MSEIIALAIVAAVIAFTVWMRKKTAKTPPRKYTEMRCPTCGGIARNYGDRWECTWCSDFGTIRKEK